MVCDLVLYALLLAWFDFFEIWKIGVVESVFLGGGGRKGGFAYTDFSSNLLPAISLNVLYVRLFFLL